MNFIHLSFLILIDDYVCYFCLYWQPVRGLTRVASTMFGNVNVADNARYLIDLCDNVERRYSAL